jgi:uncharacterized protein
MTNPKFQVFKSKSGKFYFRLRAGNGQKILGSEGYNSVAGCKSGIKSVGANGRNKKQYKILKSKSGKVYFNLLAGNKEIIGTSQMYASRDTLRKGLKSVMKNCKSKVQL